jgi:2-polyprenyl-3-methyl-5-hydroxy-6-metoxy-1,4-benzoquinol methylase
MSQKFEKKTVMVGYVQAFPRPTQKELDIFYRNVYYGKGVTSTYHPEYSEEEINQKRLRADCIVELMSLHCKKLTPIDFLEVGCGEGFLIKSSVNRGWNVTGVDYQSAPVQMFNPSVVAQVIADDPNEFLNLLIKGEAKKDIIVLQNVLEHVLDPQELLRKLYYLIADDGCLLVQVPNDFSDLQMLAHQQARIDSDYWFLPPQHLNYFNTKNIDAVANSCGFEIIDGISDFPIELYLWGSDDNYVVNRDKGKLAHEARVTLDLFFARNGIDKYIKFYRAAYQIGVGRNICVVLKKKL